MAKRIAYLLVVLLVVAGAGIVAYRTLSNRSAQQAAAPGEQPAAGTGPARILLNEILFQPVAGQPQWVELVNAGGEPATLDGIVLENHAGEKFALPNQLTLAPMAVLLVRFDGQTGTEAGTVHAAPTKFLAAAGPTRIDQQPVDGRHERRRHRKRFAVPLAGAREASDQGVIQLRTPQGQLDRIAWGHKQAGAANMSRGGYQTVLTPGTSLGRVPRLIASNPLEWVPYSPQQVTPGRSNPQPGVQILLPMDGAIVAAEARDLTWYTVAGAARYRLQLAADPSFGSPLFDQTVDVPPVKLPALAPASYVWRVQAIAADGTAAEYSAPSTLTVRAPRRQAALQAPSMLDWLIPRLHAQPSQEFMNDVLPTVLDVPMIKQHKDTAMLLLETRHDSGQHAWDVDHRDVDRADPADNMSSAPACVAMLTAYYGGRLSQDRINYEMFGAGVPGPEEDFNWGRSYDSERLTRAMMFALGISLEGAEGLPVDFANLAPSYDIDMDAWAWRAYIERGIPAIVCKNEHCVAIVGYGDWDRVLVVNDPAVGTYLAPLSFLSGAVSFDIVSSAAFLLNQYAEIETMPVRPFSDEPEVARDSDGDGVVDFDEIHRFKTNPGLKDHDGDELPDKEDIRASVHDQRHGYAYHGGGRDFDGDGKMMELDDDADNGGCLDGWEDGNKNGKFEQGPGESDNFEDDDDPCVTGDFKSLWHYVQPPSGGQGRREMEHRHTATFALRPKSDGSLTGRGQVFFEEEIVSFMPTPDCKYTMSVGPVSWTVDLTGQATRLPDGNMEVTMRATPEKGPPIPVRATNACPPFSLTQTSPAQSWDWGGPYKLVNGRYTHTLPMSPIPPGATGTQSSELTVAMKRAQRQ